MDKVDLVIRVAKQEDVKRLVLIDKVAWGEEMAAGEEKLNSRIGIYPQGQLVATIDDEIYGFMNAQRTGKDDFDARYSNGRGTWPAMSDDGYIRDTHKPNGLSLFLINLSVLPDVHELGYQRIDVGHALVSGMRGLAQSEGLERIEGITRVDGFVNWLNKKYRYDGLPEDKKKDLERKKINEYISEVVNKVSSGRGTVRDPSLEFHLRQVADPRLIIPIENAMPCDHASALWGAYFRYR